MSKKYKKILLFSTHAPRRKYSKSMFQQIKYLETIADEIHFLSFNKNAGASANVLMKISEISMPIIPVDNSSLLEHWDTDVRTKNDKTWENVYNKVDVDFLKDFDKIYVFGGILSDGFKMTRKFKDTLNLTFPNNKAPLSWASISICYFNWLAVIKAHKKFNIPLTEVAHDPDEYSIGLIPDEYYNKDIYDLNFGYANKEYGIEQLDSFQYYLNTTTTLRNVDKKYDLTFGYTIFTKTRKDTFDKIEKLVYNVFNKEKVNFFVKDKLKKEDNFINRDEYLNYILQSKYTLVIPSYDARHVSILRIQEALHNQCVPLFTSDNNLEILAESFPEAIGLIRDKLLIETFTSFTDVEYQEILTNLKQIFLVVKYLK